MIKGEINIQMTSMSTEDLLAELWAVVERTAGDIRRMAQLYNELHRRGVRVERIDGRKLADWLLSVASGRLLPELLFEYNGTPLMPAVADLLPEYQAELVASRGIVGVSINGKVQQKSLLTMDQRRIRQVLHDGRIIPPIEQKEAQSRVRVFNQSPGEGDRDWNLSNAMHPNQRRVITIAARRAKLSPATLIVRWLVQLGKLPEPPITVNEEVRDKLRNALRRTPANV